MLEMILHVVVSKQKDKEVYTQKRSLMGKLRFHRTSVWEEDGETRHLNVSDLRLA